MILYCSTDRALSFGWVEAAAVQVRLDVRLQPPEQRQRSTRHLVPNVFELHTLFLCTIPDLGDFSSQLAPKDEQTVARRGSAEVFEREGASAESLS